MGAGLVFPDVFLGLSNADPNDPAAVDTWTDLAATRTYRIRSAGRGRQYELDQNLAGRLQADLRNVDEYLNPANGTSPLLAYAKPMRRLRFRVMYPRVPVGGAVNLFNPTNITACDPSFESSTVGALPVWLAAVGGTTPTVQAANPHAGSNSLQYTVASGATIQGASALMLCLPGRQYTASIWVRQSSASTQQIGVTGIGTGTSTSTTGSYVRLSITFTATQPTHTLTLQTTGTAVAGTVNLDDWQHEPGASATTNTTSGPMIRGIWGGHTERIPNLWELGSNGYKGIVPITGVGPFAALAATDVYTEYVGALLTTAPDYYWPLWDGSGATQFAEISGHSGPALRRTDSKYGAAALFTPATTTGITGDPSGTGLKINAGATGSNTPLTVIQTGFNGDRPVVLGGALPWNVTWAFWVAHDPTTAGTLTFGRITDSTFSNNHILWQGTTTSIVFNSLTVTDVWADGKPHLFIGTRNLQSGQFTDTLWVDGVQVATNTVVVGGWLNPTNLSLVEVGADINIGFVRPGLINGVYAHTALWNRALTGPEITDLWNAGRGYAGELSGTRVGRAFARYYNGTTVVSAGSSTMGAATAKNTEALLAVLQRIQDTEGGNLFEDRDGQPRFEGRGDRFGRTTAVATLGENSPAETPYREGIGYDYDLTQVANRIQVTRTGGTVVQAVTDTASAKSYFPRGLPLTVECASDLEAQDHANWLQATRAQPRQRVQTITLDPGANPNLFPVVLDLEIGRRYTVTRRPKAANAGAGIVMTGDYFLENIVHRDVDPETGSWKVDLQLSPLPLQPWILGDATYGQLGITTVLGY